MKKGRLTTREYDRICFKNTEGLHLGKPFKSRREGLSVKEHIELASSKKAGISLFSETISSAHSFVSQMAVYNALLKAVVAGRKPKEILLTMSFPLDTEESVIREFTINAADACRQAECQFSDVSIRREEILKPVVTAVVTGEIIEREKEISESDEYYLVMVGSSAIEGSILLRDDYSARLEERYGKDFLDTREFKGKLYPARAIMKPWFSYGELASEGGVFAALETISNELHLGFDVELGKIIVDPLSVEICETLDVSPYEMLSGGCVIAATNVPEAAVAVCAEMGVKASVIGMLNKSNDKRILNHDEIRFLDSYKTDSMNLIK